MDDGQILCLGETNEMFHVRQIIERCWISPPDQRPCCAELMDDIEDVFLDIYGHGCTVADSTDAVQ